MDQKERVVDSVNYSYRDKNFSYGRTSSSVLVVILSQKPASANATSSLTIAIN